MRATLLSGGAFKVTIHPRDVTRFNSRRGTALPRQRMVLYFDRDHDLAEIRAGILDLMDPALCELCDDAKGYALNLSTVTQ